MIALNGIRERRRGKEKRLEWFSRARKKTLRKKGRKEKSITFHVGTMQRINCFVISLVFLSFSTLLRFMSHVSQAYTLSWFICQPHESDWLMVRKSFVKWIYFEPMSPFLIESSCQVSEISKVTFVHSFISSHRTYICPGVELILHAKCSFLRLTRNRVRCTLFIEYTDVNSNECTTWSSFLSVN